MIKSFSFKNVVSFLDALLDFRTNHVNFAEFHSVPLNQKSQLLRRFHGFFKKSSGWFTSSTATRRFRSDRPASSTATQRSRGQRSNGPRPLQRSFSNGPRPFPTVHSVLFQQSFSSFSNGPRPLDSHTPTLPVLPGFPSSLRGSFLGSHPSSFPSRPDYHRWDLQRG